MNIKERFDSDKECTIQYYVSELLHLDLSDYLKKQLQKWHNNEVNSFVSSFPINRKSEIPEVRKRLDVLKKTLPNDLFEEIQCEVKEIFEDCKWINSKEGRLSLQIDKWIKNAKNHLSNDYPDEYIYIGRSFINPISIIIGGYIKNDQTLIEQYFNKMNPPVTIEYRIKVYE